MKQCYIFNEDNEYYTFEKDVRDFMNLCNLDKSKVIWCPFDTNESNFVKVLNELGYKVINTHISSGEDFFNYQPSNYDVIISNPPFKGKAKVMERLIKLNKPFGLIYGIQCFNSGGFVSLLKELNNLQMVFLTRRIKFFKEKNAKPKGTPQPTFHSMWICNDLLDKEITILETKRYE